MYVFLILAIVFEIVGTTLLKSTEGFTKLLPTVASLAAYGVAFTLLAQALARGMQVGVAYALWSGLGTAIIATIGILILHEPFSFAKVGGVALIVAGVVTLNLAGAH